MEAIAGNARLVMRIVSFGAETWAAAIPILDLLGDFLQAGHSNRRHQTDLVYCKPLI